MLPAHTGRLAMIGRRIGRYRVLAPLGSGGMATVWKARDELLGHEVALKLLADALADNAEARRRFKHEAEVAATLDHPGVAAVYDSGESDGATFIAMTLIDGESLGERLARSLLPVPDALRIAAIAASALGYAHTRGVVHRDVTSRNIMLARDGRVLVVDFGLALAQGVSRVSTSTTTVGTVAYMAPEVLLGRDADPRSDLYGLGIVLYEALTGRPPFRGERPEALSFAALHQPVAPPSERRPEVPPALDRVVLKLLARDPQARYQNADEFLADLRVSRTDGSTAPAAPAGTAPGRVPPAAAPIRSVVAELIGGGTGPAHLVVAPLKVRSDGGAADAATRLAAELREALSIALTQLGRLHLVVDAGPPSVDETPGAYAARSGAHAALIGTLDLAGGLVRVAWRLVEAGGGAQVAAGQVRGASSDLVHLERELIADVRRGLGIARNGPDADLRSVARDPAEAEHFQQALLYLARFDHEASVDGAIAILERLAAASPTDSRVLAALARAYLVKHRRTQQHGWEGRAAATLERALRLAPDSPEVRIALGETHLAGGRAEQALSEFQAALATRPGDFDAHLGLIGAHDLAGRNAEAIAAGLAAIALRPADWRGYHYLGLALYRNGAFARAIEPWRHVLELTPDNALAAGNLGSTYFRMGRFADAIEACRHSLEVQPNARAFTNLGTALFYERRYPEAAEAFERAVALAPSDPVMWGNLGNARRLTAGLEASAPEALERAVGMMQERLQRDPLDGSGWALLGGWVLGLGRPAEALSAVRRAIGLAPHDASVLGMAGHTLLLAGDREGSLDALEAAVLHGYSAESLRRSPELQPLHEDERFRRILESGPLNEQSDAVLHDPGGE